MIDPSLTFPFHILPTHPGAPYRGAPGLVKYEKEMYEKGQEKARREPSRS